MEEEIQALIESVFSINDQNKFKATIGFFQSYANAESDSSGKRFCNVKLQNKDQNGDDIDVLLVPLLYIGTKRTVWDFELQKGDELAVLFSDRSLEQWKDTIGTEPQTLGNPVKDSINHAFAIPIVSHHFVNEITTSAIPAAVGGRLAVKNGDKIQIGNETDELLDLVDQLITQVKSTLAQVKTLVGNTVLGGSNPVDSAGIASTGTLGLIVSQLAQIETEITTIDSNVDTIQTSLGNIKA